MIVFRLINGIFSQLLQHAILSLFYMSCNSPFPFAYKAPYSVGEKSIAFFIAICCFVCCGNHSHLVVFIYYPSRSPLNCIAPMEYK